MTTYERIRELEHKAREEHISVDDLIELVTLYDLMDEPVPDDMRVKISEMIRDWIR